METPNLLMIENFGQLTAHLSQSGRRCRLAVVCGSDASTLEAVARAVEKMMVEVVFVGHLDAIAQMSETLHLPAFPVDVVAAASDEEAAAKAVMMVRNGEADVLVKGLVSTDVLLRAVLNKERGILPPGRVLTHVAVSEMKEMNRMLVFSDSAVIPYPTPEQRRVQISYVINLCRAFGAAEPRVALLHCSEHVSDKFPHTLDYRDIIAEAGQGRWGKVRIDGPLDLRTSIDPVALHTKGISSTLEGHADALIFPDIEAANTFYKAVTFLAHNETAGMLCGTTCPVVLPSRGDDVQTKYNSIALAMLQHVSGTNCP